MNRLLIAASLVACATSTSAFAQWDSGRDRGYEQRGNEERGYGERNYQERRGRDDNQGERVVRDVMRGITGQREEECRIVVRRSRNWEGDIVESRRRVCD